MAALVRLFEESQNLESEIYDRKNQANASRGARYAAAVKIQAWFRGTRLRAYLKYLNCCATKIQKVWRGFLARKLHRIFLLNTVFIMRLNYYNKMASKVQKTWRGYYARKYIFNFYGRKRYLEALQVKNEIIRSELSELSKNHMEAKRQKLEQLEKERWEQMARRKHYLLSTETIPGIYNSPFQPCPSEMEYLLRSVCPLSHRRKKSKEEASFDPACANYSSKMPATLPPLAAKPQGPFRDPQDVQNQRYKPFRPTLRVCTDFYSLEKARQKLKDDEWVQRINDDNFQISSQETVSYSPLLHTTTKFGHLPYGTKYFREENTQKHVAPWNFKTVVPPIPVFDQLNDTYSRGQV